MKLFLHGFAQLPELWEAAPGPCTPHLPGHGSEPVPSTHDFSEAVARFAATLPAKSFSEVVGYSMGARVAAALVLDGHVTTSRLTLMGFQPGLAPDMRSARAQVEATWDGWLAEGIDVFAERFSALPVLADTDAVRAARAQCWRRMHQASGLRWALKTLGLAASPDFRAGLAALSVPITIRVGEADAKYRQLAEDLLRELPHATLEVAAGRGHFPGLGSAKD